MNIENTKLESYYATIASDIGGRRGQVLRAVVDSGPSTRHEVSRATGLPLQTICGRISELIEMGLLVSKDVRFESATKRWCEVLAIPNAEIAPKSFSTKSRIIDDIQKLLNRFEKTELSQEEEGAVSRLGHKLVCDYPCF